MRIAEISGDACAEISSFSSFACEALLPHDTIKAPSAMIEIKSTFFIMNDI
jgi:hypothetical protein